MGLALKMLFIHLFLVIGAFVSISNAAESVGPCEQAGRGETIETCSMECNIDGSCTETAQTEYCSCDGQGQFTNGYEDYQDGQAVQQTGPLNSACDEMSELCSSCRGGTGFTARKRKFNIDSCNSNGFFGNNSNRPRRRPGSFNPEKSQSQSKPQSRPQSGPQSGTQSRSRCITTCESNGHCKVEIEKGNGSEWSHFGSGECYGPDDCFGIPDLCKIDGGTHISNQCGDPC